MTTKPPRNRPEGASEPADLSELTATDALLNRLGQREASADDRLDPTVLALSELLAEIDTEPEVDAGMTRLVEVLAGRPLYVGDEAGEPERRVIDLTDHAAVPAEEADEAEETEPAAVARIGGAEDPDDSVLPLIPGQGRRSRWERLSGQVSLPAAAVLILIALGGGVSAAVTGDPMAPVNGFSRVVEQLPGVDNSKSSLAHARGEISAAGVAAQAHDTLAARQHLAAAKRELPDVPESEKSTLGQMINSVETQLTTTTPAPATSTKATPTDSTTGAGAVATTAPTPSDSATATATGSASATTTATTTVSPPPTTPPQGILPPPVTTTVPPTSVTATTATGSPEVTTAPPTTPASP